MPSDASLFELTNAFQPVRRAWFQAATEVLADAGLTTSLATVVLHVSRLGNDVQQKVLAQEVGVNAAALVRILDLGEAAGLLTRRETKADRRVRFVELLPKGQAVADQIERRLADLRRELLRDLDEQEVREATRVLRTLEVRASDWLRGVRADAS